MSESAPAWANGSEEREPEGEGRHECHPDSAFPCEADELIVIESIANLVASDCYQDDINNENYSREESSWQDDCEVDDRSEARLTIAFGPIRLVVAPSSEKGENGKDQREKGEAAGDGVNDKGDGQRL